ncbi:hypothetical protein DesLBE_1551 [Desulfitobacterium sp. LBE]|uniref:GyrI-like domain-containing protein n=1 Tax=Desulfitobacterium sp. LBE TaxID=884086 RepID=UPI00119B451E|nr:GyrI-like domain-containing protein [Desulfitobacterium sp. LBE]TWH57283.1 hypothetical protein DesLBE_1551 [Desulfitobacterium sp. LBE]
MAGEKLDYKKAYKDLYLPKSKPMLIEVPPMNFIMVDGQGDPNPEGGEYQQAVELLYAITYTIKMSKLSGSRPAGYIEYVVPPLEGLWWCRGSAFDLQDRESWLWTSMIRQPEFVTEEVFQWAAAECQRKKPGLDVAKVRFEKFSEGLCVQMMHLGPFADEPASLERMKAFMEQNELVDMTGAERKHHEIYLSDPRKTSPEKLKTVLRHPVAKA